MKNKFPLWMTIALAVQLLVTLGVTGFGWMLAHAFSGTSSLNLWQSFILYAPPVLTALCAWLAVRKWRANQPTVAARFALAPFPVAIALMAMGTLLK